MLRTVSNVSKDNRELLRVVDRLNEVDRASVLAFAEFLAARTTVDDKPKVSVIPKEISRPAEESVVAAIRRLTLTYDMLERHLLLDDTSALMSAHIMQGESAELVIDKLESLFSNHYIKYKQNADEEEHHS